MLLNIFALDLTKTFYSHHEKKVKYKNCNEITDTNLGNSFYAQKLPNNHKITAKLKISHFYYLVFKT